jgi:hypothetical protein
MCGITFVQLNNSEMLMTSNMGKKYPHVGEFIETIKTSILRILQV